MDHNVLVRYWRAAVLAVMGTAVVLRLPWPSGWWLNPDEGIYFRAVADPSFADFWAEAMATAHPPLYFLILRAFAAVSTDFAWLRSVALVSGVAAVYAFIVLARELTDDDVRGRWAGLLAGLLIAVSPRAVSLSHVIRPYMLLLFLLAFALVFLLRAMRGGAGRALAGYATCVCLALTLHYSAVGALGVFGLIVLADGIRSGFRRPRWRRLAAAQIAPALTLAVLYAWHLRGLMDSAMADRALEGWLSSYLVQTPVDAWLALVGVHSALVGDTFASSATLLTLSGLGWAAWTRRWTVLTVGASGLVLAVVAASFGLYPMGATRHASWLLVFVTPLLAWTVATLPESERLPDGRAARAVPLVVFAALLAGAVPLSSLLDSDRRPREIAERVVRSRDVQAMSEVLSPDGGPRLVLMSTETYELLTPLFVEVKDRARTSREGGLIHLPWGVRDVIVLPARDFAALPEQLGQPNHLHTGLEAAVAELGVRRPDPGEPVLVVAGGWRSAAMTNLIELARAAPGLGTAVHVPGLISVTLDLEAYRDVLGLTAGG